MNKRLQLFLTKLKVATIANFKIVRGWKYALIVLVFSFSFIQFLYWVLNIDLFWYFLSSSVLSLTDKIDVFSSIITSYLTSLPLWQAIVVITLSLIQGIVIAVLIYIIRSHHKLNKQALGGSTIAGIVAIFSVGCVSCGTSIITPILAVFVSGSTVGLAESINQVAILMGLIAASYAFYVVGQTAAAVIAKAKFTD